MKINSILTVVCLVVTLFATSLWAADTPAKEGEAQTRDMTEVSKDLANPVSSLWALSFQQNNFMLDMGPGESRWNSNLVFQPVLPVALTEDWNLITRPVLTLFNSVPHPNPHNLSEMERTAGFGDTVLLEMFPQVQSSSGIGSSVLVPRLSSLRPPLTTPARESGRWVLPRLWATSRKIGSSAPFSRTGLPPGAPAIGAQTR